MAGFCFGGDSRPTSRTSPDIHNQHVKEILESIEVYEERMKDVRRPVDVIPESVNIV